MTQNKTIKDIWKRDLYKFKRDMKNFDLKDYVKCIRENRFTVVGLTSYVASLSLGSFLLQNNQAISPPAELMVYFTYAAGLAFTGATAFSKTTYDTYIRAKKIIRNHKQIPKKTIDTCLGTYCNTIGLNMARKEAGLKPLEMIHMLD
ncbi:hypothetical protein J4465_00315 [Candidatus Pacearchaeota archaeon]|nr:hypothetical protein [Candidatus Pacearchaeota archaeon]